MRFNTKLLHGKSISKNANGDILPPISQVSAFQYDSMEELEKVFQHKKMGFAYTRIGNPTIGAGGLGAPAAMYLAAAGVDAEDGSRVIEKVYILTNTDHTNEHFTIDPKEQLQTIKDMRANGLKPLGNWHSHPESPSRPSEEDKRLANDSKASYLILSLMEEGNPVLNAFHVESVDGVKTVRKEELVVVS